MKQHAWTTLGAVVWLLGAGVPVARAQGSPPTVELKQYHSKGLGTTVGFTLSGELFTSGHRPRVSLKIYNVLAQVVATPVLATTGEALNGLELTCADLTGCTYTAYWDGKVPNAGRQGRQPASGVYLYQLVVDGSRYTKKMVIMR